MAVLTSSHPASEGSSRRPFTVLRLALAAPLALGIALCTTGAGSGTTASATPAPTTRTAATLTRATAAPAGCQQGTAGVSEFAPTILTIPGVLKTTKVLARGRDHDGVPLPPPLTRKGKWQFAWDQQSHIGAGATSGVTRLTAHTYPRSAGTALGNLLLAKLHRGDTLVVGGNGNRTACYRVAQRISVSAARTFPAYYANGGPARLAILVCSGVRRGPGDWSRRTIWFADPLAATDVAKSSTRRPGSRTRR